ncbi:MAG: peptide chain release factor N(5)-glutamine methyltransferase [Acidimicrobiia bacterium]|nr:peptide chain release factor N(5)-glutamine methyltransferase [Acidimicrobiia bacterium]
MTPEEPLPDPRATAGPFETADVRDLRGLVAKAGQHLDWAGVTSPWHDARRLAAWAAGADDVTLMIRADEVFADPAFRTRFGEAIERRAQREPLQHIEGSVAFLDFEVEVGAGVLVPRPETEITALTALSVLVPGGRVLDCGTGTGVLAIAIARGGEDLEVHATERSAPALVWGARNIERLAPGVALHQTWFFGVDGTFDTIVANPPYVGQDEWDLLEPEVRDHDPRTALVPQDGNATSDIRLVVAEGSARLRRGGTLVCEIGSRHGREVANAAYGAGLRGIEIEEDLVGRDRVLVARKP